MYMLCMYVVCCMYVCVVCMCAYGTHTQDGGYAATSGSFAEHVVVQALLLLPLSETARCAPRKRGVPQRRLLLQCDGAAGGCGGADTLVGVNARSVFAVCRHVQNTFVHTHQHVPACIFVVA